MADQKLVALWRSYQKRNSVSLHEWTIFLKVGLISCICLAAESNDTVISCNVID